MNEPHIITTKSIIGDKVKNKDGVELGDIKELLINKETNKIEYGVLSFGGFMGVGDKQIAVPFESFEFHEEGKYFELNVDMDVLENTSTQMDYQDKAYYIY